MCDRSKWKPRSYCYSTRKIKSVPRTKWERQITSDEDYWRQYVREKEKDLIVRDSRPNLTRFPSVQRYPRTLCRGIRNNDDASNIDESTGNERKPLVESLTNFPSYRLSSFTEENDFANIREPVLTVLPPAPSKRPTKAFGTRKEERKRALAEDTSFRKEFPSLVRVNVRNASREKAKVDKTRSREGPSFRENDRPNGEKSSRSRTDETPSKAANKNYLESLDDREPFTFDDIDVNSDLEDKSNYPICALKKRTEGNEGSSTDDDFSKYFLRSAHEALKRVTKHSRSANREVNKPTKKVATKGRSEKYEKEFVNVSSISLKPLFSFGRVEEDVGDDSPRTSLTADFLNGLPKMSHFPRKKRDRCLSCLYKSLEEIGASSRKDAYERRKGREEQGKQHQRDASVERESNGDVSSEEFEDERNRSDFVGLAMKRNGECSDIAEEKKLGLPSAGEGAEEGKTSVDRVTETEGRLPVPELESTPPEGKRIALESISASSRGTSDSDEDDSTSVDLIEHSSTKSKHRPACHAPTVLSHTLEPLRALRSRKSTSVQARVALDESAESTESPKIVADGKSREIASKGTGQKATLTDTKRGKEEGDSKRVKKLTKVESVSENLITDVEVNEAKEKSLFARSSSCRDFERILRDSTKGTELASPPGLCSLAEDGPFRCLFSKGEIEETLRNLEEREASPTFALSALCDMFLNRVLESSDERDRRRDNVAKRLVKLLVESRRYSNPDKFPSDLIFSSKQRPLLNCQRLRSILPLDSYNLIAPLLGIPEYHPRFSFSLRKKLEPAKRPSDESDSLPDILDDLIVHPPSSRDSAISSETIETTRYNPYGLFLQKERRKAVVWRPLTEFDLKGYDPQATLRMRADKITTDICKEFCDWLRSLGGFERGIDERILKDMFEISFSADACKTTQVNVKEMATVPTDVALARMCHEASVLATTRKQLERDAKAESRPKRTLAFGTSMPIDLLFVPPTNRVRERWLECKNVPRELETMDIVWNGITHLESVQAFVKCLHRHPEVSPPKIFKRAVLPKNVGKFVKKRDTEM